MGKWISWLGSPLLMALLSGALYWQAVRRRCLGRRTRAACHLQHAAG